MFDLELHQKTPEPRRPPLFRRRLHLPIFTWEAGAIIFGNGRRGADPLPRPRACQAFQADCFVACLRADVAGWAEWVMAKIHDGGPRLCAQHSGKGPEIVLGGLEGLEGLVGLDGLEGLGDLGRLANPEFG